MIWPLHSMTQCEKLRFIEALSEQVVEAIENNLTTTGPRKKQLALQMLGEILKEKGLHAHPALLDQAVESSVLVIRAKFQKAR